VLPYCRERVAEPRGQPGGKRPAYTNVCLLTLRARSSHSAFGHKPSPARDCRSREMLVRENVRKGCGCTAQAARLPALWVESGPTVWCENQEFRTVGQPISTHPRHSFAVGDFQKKGR
jgi:hypothetical protein